MSASLARPRLTGAWSEIQAKAKRSRFSSVVAKYSEERYTRKLSPPPSLHSPQKSPS